MKQKDYELLRTLYGIHSKSGSEKKMRRFLKKICNALGANCVTDCAGNLLVTKGVSETYPCICAHMDQVQNQHSKDFTVINTEGIVFAYSPKSMSQQGLGADDKNGIWVALQALERTECIKCAFFVGEEIGCIGSSAVDLQFFKDCRFCLQADRRNGYDFITSVCGTMCSEEFLNDCGFRNFGYKEECGLITDVATLAVRGVGISCVNMSCGYYHPHTDEECTNLDELDNCLDLVMHIIRKCDKVYPHEMDYGWYDRYYDFGNSKKSSYDEDAYLSDWDHAYYLVKDEPWLSFKGFYGKYHELFSSQDEQYLFDIYCEVSEMFWEDAK